ncbi:MAG: 9-O-acetylesterase, partial [Muribaculaceae bacterium]|nr:9-O-acetylesterase [Muribaculaceae bacterium]
MLKRNTLILSAAVAAISADAAVTLPNYITDNMIVQQNSVLTVNGHAAAGSTVRVSAGWTDAIQSVKAGKDGKFTVSLPTPPAGGPYTITFLDKDGRVNVENVVSGDIWFCSGQSNMEFPVQGWTTVMGYDREVATAHHPDIRLLQVRKKTAIEPQEDIEVNGGGWQICSSASMADFSAIAYFFARELHEELGIPIGVIDSTWGGTPAEAWTSAYALGAVPGFEGELADLKAAAGDMSRLNSLYDKRVEDWMKKANASDLGFDKGKLQAGAEWKAMQAPGYWEQAGLPGFDGIVWMQREIEVPADLAGKPLTLR